MIELVRKRHPAPGWMVIQECGNGTGGNVSRHADAIALSIWPSHGYALHGFEFKASRADLKKELSDPSKADAIGRYCDYWWLVVEKLELLEGVVVPETWGILFPKSQVLRVHRKAPKREADAVDRAFAAAMIRKVADNFVPKHEHETFKKNARELARKEVEQERKYAHDDTERQLLDMQGLVASFEKFSGVKLTQEYAYDPGVAHPIAHWQIENIGEGVKAVVAAREAIGRQYFQADDAAALARRELEAIERVIEGHERAIAHRRSAASNVRELIAKLSAGDPAPPPATAPLPLAWDEPE